MAIITFWNPERRQSGQTMSAIAISTYLAIESNSKVLLLSTECNDKMLESAFDLKGISKLLIASIVKDNKINLDSGVDGLATISYSNKLTPKIIRDYTKVVFKNRLELIYAPTNTERTEYEKILSSYKDILNCANQYYDYVIVDFNKGFHPPYTETVLNMSDVIIINLQQRISKINEFANLKKREKILNNKKNMLLINKYDPISKYNKKNLSRYLGKKDNIYVLPYNTLFMEASEEGNVAELFLRIRKIKEDDKNGNFFSEIGKTVDGIKFKLQELRMTK